MLSQSEQEFQKIRSYNPDEIPGEEIRRIFNPVQEIAALKSDLAASDARWEAILQQCEALLAELRSLRQELNQNSVEG